MLNREKYGEVSVRVDYAKKENRAKSADVMTLTEFLNTYNDSDQYLVDSLPEEMWGEFILPPCLLCGGFTSRLQARIFCLPRCFYISFSKWWYQCLRLKLMSVQVSCWGSGWKIILVVVSQIRGFVKFICWWLWVGKPPVKVTLTLLFPKLIRQG